MSRRPRRAQAADQHDRRDNRDCRKFRSCKHNVACGPAAILERCRSPSGIYAVLRGGLLGARRHFALSAPANPRRISMARSSKKSSVVAKHGKRGGKPFCKNLLRPVPQLPPAVAADPRRAAAIILGKGKWANGTVLHYCFFGGGSRYAVPKVHADAVRAALAKWKAIGIGLDFQEVNQLSEAEVRIGFSVADGSSASAVGREVLTVPLNEPTTVYGWDLRTPY